MSRIEEGDDIQVYKKPWVGLTEDEISSCDPFEEIWDLFKIARKLEAKLREKNST